MPSAPQQPRTILFFQHRPAVLFALYIALGIGFSNSLPCNPWLWLGLAAALLSIAVFIRSEFLNILFLNAVIILIGISAAQIERFKFPTGNIADYTTDSERFAQIELTIDQTPRLLSPSPQELRSLLPKQTASATAHRINTNCGWKPASGKIILTIEQPNPQLAAGQTVRVTGMLERPMPPMNPGEFDYAAWCRQQRVSALFRVSHSDGVQILDNPGPGPLAWLREKTRHLLAMGFNAQDSFNHSLLRAFVLGDPDPQLRDLDQKFVQTGTIHYLAISGLHVAIIGAMTLLICRLLRCSPRVAVMIALGTVLLYATVATPSWPGWRSIILCATASLGMLGRRLTNTLHMFALSVAAVLLIHPADLFDGGFQVSFAAVLGLILFTRFASQYFLAWWRGPDPPPLKVRQRGAMVIILQAIWHFLISSVLACCIAWALSMPLIAYHFGQLSLWAIPAGVVLLPLTFLALIAGVSKIVLTLCWPSAAHACAMIAVIPIEWMRHVIERLDQFPGAAMRIQAPPLTLLIAYYGLIALMFVPIRKTIFRWLMRTASAAAMISLFLLPTVARAVPAPTASPIQPLRITLLSIGAGQCGILEPTASHALLIDAGSSTISDVASAILLPALRARGYSAVDGIYLSHGDFDHISAAAEVFNQFNHLPLVFTSPHFARHAVGNLPAEALLQTLRDAARPPKIIHQGDHFDLGNGVVMDVLWPPVNCDMNSNDCGLVLKISFAGRTVLFPADIQDAPERELLKHPELLRSDVLIAPHHGSAEITTADFIRAVHPRFILASNAEKLTHKQRVFDSLAKDYPLYRTSRCGAIDVTIEPSGEIEVQTFLGVGPR